ELRRDELALTEEQVDKLLQLVSTTRDDQLDCDGCLQHIAEFADAQLANQSLSVALEAVQAHLACCPCCADEYQALLDALQILESDA
ncbi:MAG: hypothetical protein AAF961_00040, partial [Planctomycetota bacterium]